MLKTDSHFNILREVNLHNKLMYRYVKLQTGEFNDTVTGNLQQFNDREQFISQHGNVVSPYSHFRRHTSKEIYGNIQKKIITQKEAVPKDDGMYFLNGGGITVIESARVYTDDGVSDNHRDVVKKKVKIESSKKPGCVTIAAKINCIQTLQIC